MHEQTPDISQGPDAETDGALTEPEAGASTEVGALSGTPEVAPAEETAGEADFALATEEPVVEDDDSEEEPERETAPHEPPPPPDEELLSGLQCILFVAGEPLPVDRLAQALGKEVTDIAQLCDQLNERMAGQGLHVRQLGGGFALATRPEFADYVQRLLEPEPERLSMQALETLAIVAYRQPITRPEIDQLRGVNSGGVVASLLEKGLLRIKGRKDAPGRPFMLETTPHFLSAFGLGDLSDLPKMDLPEMQPGPDEPRVLGEALEELVASPPEEELSDD